jgi:hypothetical protein
VGLLFLKNKSCWPFIVEAQVSPHGICGGQSMMGTGYSLKFFGFLLLVSFHQVSIVIYHLGDDVWDHWWLQLRDIVATHQREQHLKCKHIKLFLKAKNFFVGFHHHVFFLN